MATACLFLGFNKQPSGRAKEAHRFLLKDALASIQRYQRDGWLESHQLISLSPPGAHLNALILLHGDRTRLDELRRTEDFERLATRLDSLFSGYSVIPEVLGQGIPTWAERNPASSK